MRPKATYPLKPEPAVAAELPGAEAASLSKTLLIDWAQRPRWSTLSLDHTILGFLQRWQSWRQEPLAPRVMHEVVLCAQAPGADTITGCAQGHPALEDLARLLVPHCYGLIDGFHRILLDGGRVQLTLCVGQPIKRLRELQFRADAIELDVSSELLVHADLPRILARLCGRRTILLARAQGMNFLAAREKAWVSAGFHVLPAGTLASITFGSASFILARYDPAWKIRRSRRTWSEPGQNPGLCTVVGAGLAGAAVAAVMARRGWTVTVLEAADAAAAGASGAPLGLLTAHLSADDCTLSQISRAGMRLTLSEAARLLRTGHDWAPTGVFEHDLGKQPRMLQKWAAQGQDWYQIRSAPSGNAIQGQGVFHQAAGWLKPAKLVRAWLSQPGITLRTCAPVHTLRREDGQWQVLGGQDQVLSQSDLVVLANASGASALLKQGLVHQPLPAIGASRLNTTRGMRGVISSSRHTDTSAVIWPAHPIKGAGFAAGHIPCADGQRWFVGASYQNVAETERTDFANHQKNFNKLRALDLQLADSLVAALERGEVESWRGIRCTTQNHLPIVGPVNPEGHPGLWVCFGLGSRGISLAMLCAEILASRLNAEPLPLPAKLAVKLDPSPA